MKVLVAVWSIRIGGAETFALQLCEYLQRKGETCYLFPVTGPWDEEYYQQIEEKGVKVLTPFSPGILDWAGWKINAIFDKFFQFNLRLYLTELYFKYIINKYSFNCIVSNSCLSDRFILQQKRFNIPFIIVEHGEYSYKVVDRQDFVVAPLFKANRVVFVSKWCRETLLPFLDNNLRIKNKVIYNGHKQVLPNKKELSQRKLGEVFVFGMIGRGVEYKGWKEGIEAFIKINNNFPKTRLLLIGDGEFLQELKSKYVNFKSILFVGRQTNPQDWIQYVDVGLVLSQKYEAFGIAILDFFAQRIPVIATKVGGIPEVVHSKKKGGILISVNEKGIPNIAEITAAMEMMMNDNSKRVQFSIGASEIYEYFSFEQTGRKYLNLIYEVIRENERLIHNHNKL